VSFSDASKAEQRLSTEEAIDVRREIDDESCRWSQTVDTEDNEEISDMSLSMAAWVRAMLAIYSAYESSKHMNVSSSEIVPSGYGEDRLSTCETIEGMAEFDEALPSFIQVSASDRGIRL